MEIEAPEIAVAGRDSVSGKPRREILDAAANCFMSRGYANTSIDDVARSLGSTKGRIYHHYASKADLFADVFKTGMDMNYQALQPALEDKGAAEEKLVQMAKAHARQMIDTQSYQRAVWEGVSMHLRGSTTPEQRETLIELLDYRDRYSDMFKSVLAQCKANGSLDYESVSIATQLMFVALNSPLFWYTPRPGETEEDINRITEQVVTFAMRGLGYNGKVTQ